MSKWHGGKGSSMRKGANNKKFSENWDKIFGKKSDVVHDKCGTEECCGECQTETKVPEFFENTPRIP